MKCRYFNSIKASEPCKSKCRTIGISFVYLVSIVQQIAWRLVYRLGHNIPYNSIQDVVCAMKSRTVTSVCTSGAKGRNRMYPPISSRCLNKMELVRDGPPFSRQSNNSQMIKRKVQRKRYWVS